MYVCMYVRMYDDNYGQGTAWNVRYWYIYRNNTYYKIVQLYIYTHVYVCMHIGDYVIG